jgi:hypothetical protein
MHCQRRVRWIKHNWQRCHALHRHGLLKAGFEIEEYLIPNHRPLLVRTGHTPPTATSQSIQTNHLQFCNLNLDLRDLRHYYEHIAQIPRRTRFIQGCHLQQNHLEIGEALRWAVKRLTTHLFRVLDYSPPPHLALIRLLSTALGSLNLIVLTCIQRTCRHLRRLTLPRLNMTCTLAIN